MWTLVSALVAAGLAAAAVHRYWTHAQRVTLVHNATSELIPLLRATCPRLFARRFVPTPWMTNGHVQTVFTSVSNALAAFPEVRYVREEVLLPDGGCITLDWNEGPWEPTTPTLVLLHGLTGGSQEGYIKSTVDAAMRSGVRSVVFNARGCAGSRLRTSQIFCAAYTDDLRHALAKIRAAVPDSPLVAAGFSLGSNILVKYLGEEGDRTPLLGAVSLGNPFDLMCAMRRLEEDWLHDLLYNRTLAGNLKRFYSKHQEDIDDANVDPVHVHRAQSIKEFDDRLTRVLFGYQTVAEYYQDASSNRYVTKVEVPLLVMNAKDDPISCGPVIPYDECRVNPFTLLCATERGGHLGWHTGLLPEHWSSQIVVEYARALFSAHTDGMLQPIVERLREHKHAQRSVWVPKALSGRTATFSTLVTSVASFSTAGSVASSSFPSSVSSGSSSSSTTPPPALRKPSIIPTTTVSPPPIVTPSAAAAAATAAKSIHVAPETLPIYQRMQFAAARLAMMGRTAATRPKIVISPTWLQTTAVVIAAALIATTIYRQRQRQIT